MRSEKRERINIEINVNALYSTGICIIVINMYKLDKKAFYFLKKLI